MSHERLVLLGPNGRAVRDGRQRAHQQIAAELGQLGRQLVGGLTGDRATRLGAIRTRVHAVADTHDGHAGLGIALKDGALDGGRAAPTRKQRGMNVHAAQRRHGEHLVGQDAAVGGHAEDLGLGSAQGVEDLGRHAIGLHHGQAELECGLLHR